ncbi:unnamed protein product [Leptidea sinapis]|uniref:Uncharacterized protein n=1 Tax=Leptidea sinapis TaxID=189913 RepID=A0A5E4PX91_9NEOP|nr:unnamed protein product [Leptidea sinapis]
MDTNLKLKKLKTQKENINNKRGGESGPLLVSGQTIFAKAVNKRQAKDKPRFQKAVVTGQIDRNVVPIKLKDRINVER